MLEQNSWAGGQALSSMLRLLLASNLALVACGVDRDESEATNGQRSRIIVDVVEHDVSSICLDGGIRVLSGADRSADGVLQEAEVVRVVELCHADHGKRAVARVAAIDSDENCPDGGIRFQTGFDHDGNGTLEDREALRVEAICHGAASTAAMASLLRVQQIFPNETCAEGGVLIQTGFDVDGQLDLDANEVQSETVICHGLPGAVGTSGSSCRTFRSEEQEQIIVQCDDGTEVLLPDGERGDAGASGALGNSGPDGVNCSVADGDEPNSAIIRCDDGTVIHLRGGIPGETGDAGVAGGAGDAGSDCSVVRDENIGAAIIECSDGTRTVIYDGSIGQTGDEGDAGPTGDAGVSCTVEEYEDAGWVVVSCEDGSATTITTPRDGPAGGPGETGPQGPSGSHCSVVQNNEEQGITITCDDGRVVTLHDGASGEPGEMGAPGDAGLPGIDCSASRDDATGTVTVNCADGTVLTLQDGEDGWRGPIGQTGPEGLDGMDCSVSRHNTSATFVLSCEDGTLITITDGNDGTPGAPGAQGPDGDAGADCSVVRNDETGTTIIECSDGTSMSFHDGSDGQDGQIGLSTLIRMEDELGGPECPNGGVRVMSGIDENRDDELQDVEVRDEVMLCSDLEGPCAVDYVKESDGTCVSECYENRINGGDGNCVPLGTCSAGFHNGGAGECITDGSCTSGYHLQENVCVSSTEECEFENGEGERSWTGAEWGSCLLKSCDAGFHPGGDGTCVEVGSCAVGFQEGGVGDCVPEGTCSEGYHDGGGRNFNEVEWTLVSHLSLAEMPAGSIVKDGAWNGQSVVQVDGRNGWRQRSDWNVIYIPIVRGEEDLSALQVELHHPGTDATAGIYPFGDIEGYNWTQDFMQFNLRPANMGAVFEIGAEAATAIFSSNAGVPTNQWVTLRVEMDARTSMVRFLLDNEEIFEGEVDVAALSDKYVQLRTNTRCCSVAPDITWANLRIETGGEGGVSSSSCVPVGTCSTGFHNDGTGVCAPIGTCHDGYHDGGDGSCVDIGACASGYHDGGDGNCVENGTCSAGYMPNPSGDCVQPNCGAIQFDGVDDYVQVNDSESLRFADGAQTVSFFIRIDSFPSDGKEHYIMEKMTGKRGFHIALSDWNDGNVLFYRFGEAVGAHGRCELPFEHFRKEEFVHVVVSYDGSYPRCYLNGVLTNQGPYIQTQIDNANAPLRFGHMGTWNNSTSSFLFAALSDVTIWSRALSAEEVKTAGNTLITDGLVGRWRAMNADGVLLDSSGNGNHGALHGGFWEDTCPADALETTLLASNWNFENWLEENPPIGYEKITENFVVTAETSEVEALEGGESSARVTWSSNDAQVLVSTSAFHVSEGTRVQCAVRVLDQDESAEAKALIRWKFNDATSDRTTLAEESSLNQDSWQEIFVEDIAPQGAAAFACGVHFTNSISLETGESILFVDNLQAATW